MHDDVGLLRRLERRDVPRRDLPGDGATLMTSRGRTWTVLALTGALGWSVAAACGGQTQNMQGDSGPGDGGHDMTSTGDCAPPADAGAPLLASLEVGLPTNASALLP